MSSTKEITIEMMQILERIANDFSLPIELTDRAAETRVSLQKFLNLVARLYPPDKKEEPEESFDDILQ